MKYFIALALLSIAVCAFANDAVSRTYVVETEEDQFEAFLSDPQEFSKRSFQTCPNGVACPSSGQKCCCALINGQVACMQQNGVFLCFDTEEWQCCPYVPGKSALQACNRSKNFKCASSPTSVTGQTCVPGQDGASVALTFSAALVASAVVAASF